jgi:outer membrane lipoprotein LolB
LRRSWLALLPILAACAQLPAGGAPGVPLVPPSPPLSTYPAAPLARFHLEGRLQVRDGERLAAVGVDWQHDGERDDWLFSGPLGQGLARIEAGPDGALLTAADGRTQQAASAAELGAAVLGLQAPFDALAPWATARLRSGAELRAVDALGRPQQLIDQGWTVDYLDYTDPGAAALPRQLAVHRGDTRLRLVIDAWNP